MVNRRPRSSMRGPLRIGLTIETEAKQRLDLAAAAAGLSSSHLVQLLVEQMELDAQGVPVGITPAHKDEELPITGT